MSRCLRGTAAPDQVVAEQLPARPQTSDEATVTRVLHSGNPRGEDYRAAEKAIKDIRERLSHIRGELEDLGRIEASLPHDRRCNDIAGTLTLTLIVLYQFL